MVYLSLSLACCYGFIFFQNSRPGKIPNRSQQFNHDFKNLSLTYAIFTAILFFVTSFIDSRMVLISGYCFGLAGLLLSNYTLVPYLESILTAKREGSRSIILKGFNKPTADKSKSYDTEKARVHDLISRELGKKQPAKSVTIDETEYLNDDSIRASENQESELIAQFKGSRSRFRFNSTRKENKVEPISR